ncbi:unnamed protein product [Ceratitis capitata]|uniref:(Mediterranean fruit fly) hypothetical protein n=1 Tax=Ceratitis capitata TaxID=7213 RepID=A0A811UIW2_CERCA|nr:unnamed protein product [Ceratitis capitata]
MAFEDATHQLNNSLSFTNQSAIGVSAKTKQNGTNRGILPQIDSNFIEMSKPSELNVSRALNARNNKETVKMFGWGKFQPTFLQRFCTAKWALFWLCWGGAMQAQLEPTTVYNEIIYEDLLPHVACRVISLALIGNKAV